MLTIDGSKGEGGGQILRTAVAMAAITGVDVRIENIRANRPDPGLKAQHLNGIKAVAELCDAEVKGLNIKSHVIEFCPDEIKGGEMNIDIGTAGSITLILQALMVPAMFADDTVKIKIRGGTDVKWSPPLDYLRFVTSGILKKSGYDAEINLLRRGYYPKGGGEVEAVIHPAEIKKINLAGRGEIKRVLGISHSHTGLRNANVAQRQAMHARKILVNNLLNLGVNEEVNIREEYQDAFSYGSGITLWAETENSLIGASSLGEKGKMAELVGKEAAEDLIREIKSDAPLDMHMADQIIPYLALAKGKVKASRITRHARTNVLVVNQFGFDVGIDEDENVIYSG
ncbi:MAG: RNA 3'-terminal-phosphate cyclase [Candidatus Altiarchaeales archaeon WOR_SM1_86-2]|nr:MAG: RNA 3'-terminal-phosphate cyclase [Candidatus Altiarchaeales archaeon WOR_SM1_86-2]ODS38716.1 MAG: RNA 3'-terminal-phosphate cyclase [Candidatus Altiarchaeales archaeon WOR_SM1_79]